MNFNWIDIVLLVILVVTVLFGILRGFVKQVIGLLAIVIGLILAVNYYPVGTEFFHTWIKNETLNSFLGFIAIFFLVILMGGILSFIFTKMIRGPLKFINRFFGGAIGLLKGVLICGVFVFGLFAFPFNTDALKQSLLAPYCAEVTKAVFYLIPAELKIKFNEAYQELVQGKEKDAREI